MATPKKPKTKPKPQTFEEAAAELGEARPLKDVLRQIVKPEKKTAIQKAAAITPKKGE